MRGVRAGDGLSCVARTRNRPQSRAVEFVTVLHDCLRERGDLAAAGSRNRQIQVVYLNYATFHGWSTLPASALYMKLSISRH